MIAEKIGEDPAPYREEADRILKALNARLWIPERGHWAEFQDFMGHKRLHTSPGVWTIYHALDSDIADPFQAYLATSYVDREIPHIPVCGDGLKDEGYATISTTNWLPYSWSINNVAFAEVMHTALAYFQAGRADAGFHLLKSSVLDGMYLGESPGNFGQISFYDAARGECYRDFGDPIGVASRVLIQGLYGILPDAMNGRLLVKPGLPSSWLLHLCILRILILTLSILMKLQHPMQSSTDYLRYVHWNFSFRLSARKWRSLQSMESLQHGHW